MLSSVFVYFLYGLAFFSMGLMVAFEGGHASDERLRKALRPLMGFGLVHGIHEWLEMISRLMAALGESVPIWLTGVSLATLAFSFLSLAAFGAFLLSNTRTAQRVSLIVPLALESIWVFGLAVFVGRFQPGEMLLVADTWTRYVLAIPASILAAIGLVAQQRAFRHAGLVRFGQDSLWAAVAFGWYGLIGQFFNASSPLFPSNIINTELFLNLFGFPVQIVRAFTASAAALFVIRFMRAFQVENEAKVVELKEARLRESQERETLRSELYRRVVEAQELERQRIARDLHDETGQSLTALGMGLRSLRSTLESGKGPLESKKTLQTLETMVDESLQELQRLISDLRPSHLDDLGLAATLRWYASIFRDRYNLDVSVHVVNEERPICSEHSTTLFRMAQEALTNVVKHAEATQARLSLIFDGEGVHLAVEDNGRGFDVEKGFKQQSWGLLGLQERAALLDGTCQIYSSPGRGTIVEISVPYCTKHMMEAANGDTNSAGG